MKILKRKKYSIFQGFLKFSFILTIAFTFIMPMVFVSPTSVNADGEGIQVNTTINNPLGEGNLETIPAFIEKILKIVVEIGIPIVTLAIIYSGFLFVQAQGSPEKLKKAKDALLYTLIGATLLLGAYVLAAAIGSTVDQIKTNA